MNSVESLPTHSSPSERKLRVLFVSHAYVVGVNQGKLDAIAATDRVEVGLLVPSNWKSLEWHRQIPVETPYPRINIYQAPALFSGRGGAYTYAPWDLLRVMRDFQPDLVQVEAEVFSLIAFEVAIWCRLTRTPVVVFGWENIARQLPALRQFTCQLVMDTASALMPGNQDGANILRQWGYIGKIEVMPQMGVDTQLFAPSLERTERSPFNIGFLGRLVPEKGIDTLLAAARVLQSRGKDFKITICGSGRESQSLQQLAIEYQINDRVIWLDAVRHEAAPAQLTSFDVMVLPSRSTPTWREQFGHVLIEAMAMGVAVIGSNCGEIPHVIGRADLIFDEDNAIALAVILERIIDDPNWRQEVSKFGLDRVRQLYSHARIAERSISLWQSIIHNTTGNESSDGERENLLPTVN